MASSHLRMTVTAAAEISIVSHAHTHTHTTVCCGILNVKPPSTSHTDRIFEANVEACSNKL